MSPREALSEGALTDVAGWRRVSTVQWGVYSLVDCLFSLRTSPGTVALANERPPANREAETKAVLGFFGEPEQYETARAP
jgi:hypothetical protein